uniref:Uncharacterized protein n=1 Tax=Utricularia reniformis TaxID=192314 RepID=A0A1Y0B3A2_9LAMI|nr:hypothetical protein AEK19_MT1724 [Utricularia reniformis]ART31902.1 hypothetical protein AEK19_MT1724 [Utricularia reniformis]
MFSKNVELGNGDAPCIWEELLTKKEVRFFHFGLAHLSK